MYYKRVMAMFQILSRMLKYKKDIEGYFGVLYDYIQKVESQHPDNLSVLNCLYELIENVVDDYFQNNVKLELTDQVYTSLLTIQSHPQQTQSIKNSVNVSLNKLAILSGY